VPAQAIAMRRIREVLRLKYECALSNAQIAAAVRIAKGSVANYLAAAITAGLTYAETATLDDAALRARLQPASPGQAQFAQPDFAHVHREFAAQGRDAAAVVGRVSGAGERHSLQPLAVL